MDMIDRVTYIRNRNEARKDQWSDPVYMEWAKAGPCEPEESDRLERCSYSPSYSQPPQFDLML